MKQFTRLGVLVLTAVSWISLAPAAWAQQDAPVYRVKAHLRGSGQTLTVQKTIDPKTGATSSLALDEQGQAVDYAAALRRERELATRPEAKLVAPLPQVLAEAAGEPVMVGVWLKFDPKSVDFRADLQIQLDGGVPHDLAKGDLLGRLEAGNRLAVEPARALLAATGAAIVSSSRFVPIVFVMANAAQVNELARLDVVEGLYSNVVFHDVTDDAINTHRWNRVHNFNIRGDGVKVAVLEDNGIDDAACVSNILNVTAWNNVNHNIQDHPTGCASVIGSMNASNPGHARGIQILSANGTTGGGAPSYATADIIAASDWAIGQGANVVNCSFGFDNTPQVLQMIDRYVDYQVRFSTTTFAVSAGNNGNSTTNVSSPGVSWNCITVGAIDDANTASWADDVMASYSSFNDPNSTHGDREKPEVAAEGTNMTMLNLGCAFTYVASGTSFAAPGVAGMCGALMQMDSTLKYWPEAMKAVMMAAATHNIEGASALSDKDGAGGINGYQAYRLVEQGKYAVGTVNPSSFTATGYFTHDIYLQGGDKARVCLVWDSLSSGPAAYATDIQNADLDIAILPGAGQTIGPVLASSSSFDNTYEIVEFCPPSTGWYTVRVNDYRFDGLSEYFGLAWTQQADGRYAHYRQWLPEATYTDAIGPTIGNQYFWLDPVDFANGGKIYASIASAGTGTGIDLPGACRHSFGDYDFLTNLLLDNSNPWFLSFLGVWNADGTTYNHRFAIPDEPLLPGLPVYLTILTVDPAAPDQILEIGQMEKVTFWSHATDLVLGDDGSSGPLNLGFSFPFYGTSYTQCYVNANGNITFGSPDSTYSESVSGFTSGLPRIAPFWDDLNMNLGGKIRYRTAGAAQFIVEWVGVPEYGTSASNQNSVICVLNADGTIEFYYGGCSLQDAIVGISPGGGAGGTPADFSHGFVTSLYGNAFYQEFTGVAPSTFDLGIFSSYRNKLRFTRLSSFNYRATFESP